MRAAEIMYVPQLTVALRARRWLVAVGVVVGLLGGLLLASQMPTQYSATATVKLGPGFAPAGQVSDDTRAGDTEAQIAALQPQVDEVARILEVEPDAVAENLRVANRSGTSLVDFTYDAETDERAERGAAVAAQVYLDRAMQTARDEIDGRMALLRQQATVTAPDNRDAVASELRNLELTVVEPGSIVRDPADSAEQSVLRPATYVAVGLVGGAILGALLALLVEAAAPRIRAGVPIPGLRLLGRITEEVRPRQAHRMFLPAMVGSDARVLLVPIGRCADAVAELLTRTLPDVATMDHADRDDLEEAAAGGQVVLLVLEDQPVSDVRALVERLAMVEVAPAGMVTVTEQATELAMQVLVEAETDAAGREESTGTASSSQLDALLESLR
ncbi:hypothetical protein KUV85_11595 [Nocardioides panacisoli]|uniref:hypothetical protein n=1 Tax=Nocardioides panacisoli TaxID=627624 RepID=UPI001C63AE35|nr:hypothetical protein [Nocardioides panacisoli]QYJ02977.1 hypothetical protein KUV85_11595 [Nocardioides panacisoli]